MVSQEFPLVGQLSVAENLLLGRRPKKRRFLLDKEAINAAAREMLAEVDVDIPIRRRVDSLFCGAKAAFGDSQGARPQTSCADPGRADVRACAGGIGPGAGARSPACGWRGDRDLRRPPLARSESGGGLVIVLRNGRVVSDLVREEATEQRLVRDMVGKEIGAAGEVASPMAGARSCSRPTS